MSIEEHLRKLELKDGDIVLVGPHAGLEPELIGRLRGGFVPKNCSFVYVKDVNDIRKLSTEEIRLIEQWLRKWKMGQKRFPSFAGRNLLSNLWNNRRDLWGKRK